MSLKEKNRHQWPEETLSGTRQIRGEQERETKKERWGWGGGVRGEEHTHHTHISYACDGRTKVSGSVVNTLILQVQLITPA